MDQPAEAAIAAIVLFLAAGYFLRSRPETPAPAPAATPQPQPALAPSPAALPAALPAPVQPAPEPEVEPPVNPAFQTYLSFLSGIRDPAANSPETAQRAAHWSD